jgi:hypothetical protein
MNERTFKRFLPDGRSVQLIAQLFNWLLVINAPEPFGSEGYEAGWEFLEFTPASEAFLNWDPMKEAEPKGWYRQVGTGRRRPNGDPALEYVRR